jgi:GT2 family glycosyltransferase
MPAPETWLSRQKARLALLWRALRPSGDDAREIIFASLRRRVLGNRIGGVAEERAAHEIDTLRYQDWIGRFDALKPRDREAIAAHIEAADFPVPLVFMVFDAASFRFAAVAVEHLRRQLLSRFEALFAFTADCPNEAVASARKAAKGDPRFTFSCALFSEIDASLAQHDHVLLAQGGVLLREHALYMFLVAAREHGAPCLLYADEDHLDAQGIRRRPFFKPCFSPELLRRSSYLGPCMLLRGIDFDADSLLRGGPSALPDFIAGIALKLGGQGTFGLPFVLYHDASSERPNPAALGERTLPEARLPSVSIVIPTRDSLDLLAPCLASIEQRTSYLRDRLEIVVVDNGSEDPDTLAFLQTAVARGAIRLVRDAEPFNYARLNNRGAKEAKGDVLVFLNNDTLIDDPDWLKLLVGQAMQEDVAAVGPKLLYPDRSVQFGGTVIGIQGVAGHAHVDLAETDGGYRGLANRTHEVSAQTGACLAIRRQVFEELGGLDPKLAVACNDVLLCAEALKRGYRNIYVAKPVVVHLESKSRGFDDTQTKYELFLEEGRYTRSRHRALFQNDPYYSPNLSYERTYDIAFPPRREKPWRRHMRAATGKLRVLMLSSVHGQGHGVPVVLRLQAEHLAGLGHEVFIGGPDVHRGIPYEGCRRVELHDPMEAAAYAVANDVDVIVAHTPPFFSVVRWVGAWPCCILYDYGEPPAHLFVDTEERAAELAEKRFAFGIADCVFAISSAVRAEADRDGMGVIRLGNAHLGRWSEALLPRRERTRARQGWEGKAIVFSVCRFHRAERRYKGINVYAEVAERFHKACPALTDNVLFVLAGKGTREDVAEVEALGISAIANLSDAELTDLYAAADIYMSFSQWEGYNLGIGQALALGLPVIASDIPAHREFGIAATNDPAAAAGALAPLVEAAFSGRLLADRAPRLWTWDEPLAAFAAQVENACR